MTIRATLRRLAPQMTKAEREAALHDANKKMEHYHLNRPPIHKVLRKRKLFEGADGNAHFLQALAASTFFAAFLVTPFLGRKIAQDEEFRKKYIPSWYDYSMEKPDYAWTRAELHEQFIQVQRELHERAIKGDFTPDKLEEMRRKFPGREGEEVQQHGWDNLHPGIDDDDDLEDD